MATLFIEGQFHEIPDGLVNNGTTVVEQDENLRQALRPNFDLAANATFQRVVNDGKLTVTVLKAPGRKGVGALYAYQRLVQRLRAAPSEVTPIVALACHIQLMEARQELDVETLIYLRPRIARALTQGQKDHERMTIARRVLSHAPAVVSKMVPVGL